MTISLSAAWFAISDWVAYHGKGHTFKGFVTAICSDGQIVVEAHGASDGTYRGMKHIYAPSQLEHVDRTTVECFYLGCSGEAVSTVDVGEGPIAVCRECAGMLEKADIKSPELKIGKPYISKPGGVGWMDEVGEVDTDGIICAALGCKRDATTHVKFEGINAMLCDQCNRGLTFYRQAMEANKLKDDMISRSAGAYPAECMAADYFDPNGNGRDRQREPKYILNPKHTSERLDDSFKESVVEINKDLLYTHDCGCSMSMNVETYEALEREEIDNLPCVACKDIKPHWEFTWVFCGFPILATGNNRHAE